LAVRSNCREGRTVRRRNEREANDVSQLGKSIPTKIAVAGAGAVGMAIIEALDAGIDGCRLVAVSMRNRDSAETRLAHLRAKVPVVGIEALEPFADLVVECAPAQIFARIAEPFLRKGKTVVALSAAAILSNERLIEIARECGGQIVVPTGAILGLDAVTAAAESEIRSVRMVTRKPPRGLSGAPYLVENDIRVEDTTEPMLVYRGAPRGAAIGFPANLNVSVALSLAGIGPDRTSLEIWADPTVERNCHTIEVESDSANFSMSIENVPSGNPRTGRITALSVISYLRKMNAPLRVGS
jgi:aspartate dehydrogenase